MYCSLCGQYAIKYLFSLFTWLEQEFRKIGFICMNNLLLFVCYHFMEAIIITLKYHQG